MHEEEFLFIQPMFVWDIFVFKEHIHGDERKGNFFTRLTTRIVEVLKRNQTGLIQPAGPAPMSTSIVIEEGNLSQIALGTWQRIAFAHLLLRLQVAASIIPTECSVGQQL